jgi:hypothetical protein
MPFPDHISRFEQQIPTTIDTAYTLTFDVTNFSMGTNRFAWVYIGTSSLSTDVASLQITGDGSKTLNFTAGIQTWLWFTIDGTIQGGPGSFKLDNVEILEDVVTIIKEGGFAQLIAGMAAVYENVRKFLWNIGFIRDPYKTPILSDLEKEYGIFTDTNLAEQERREKLAAVKYARAGGGTIDDMQTALDRAFPDAGFVVYDNDPAQDPGAVISDNLLADGDMEQTAVTPPWTVGNSATITKEVVSPKTGLRNLKIARNAVDNPYAQQSALEVGKEYRFRGWARGDGNAFPQLIVAGQVIWTGTSSTTWQYFDVVDTTISSGNVRLTSDTSTGTEYTEWDDVSITESGVLIVNGAIFRLYVDYTIACGEADALCGEAAAQAGENNGIVKQRLEYPLPTDPLSWPLVFFVGGQARYYSLLLDGDMERTDFAAWTAGSGATLSKETTDPKQGDQYLRVTNASAVGDGRQTILTIGDDYRIIGWYRGDGTTTATIRQGGGLLESTVLTDWTKVDFEFTATGTTFELGKTAAGNFAEFDDFQVIPIDTQLNQMECGEALAQCGEELAQSGAYAGGIISIDRVQVSEDRQPDLERLILSIKPMHSWCLLFVDYV